MTIAEKLIEEWNANNPIGTPVYVRRDNGNIERSCTRSVAWLLGGHTPVVQVDGVVGCYALERVTLDGRVKKLDELVAWLQGQLKKTGVPHRVHAFKEVLGFIEGIVERPWPADVPVPQDDKSFEEAIHQAEFFLKQVRITNLNDDDRFHGAVLTLAGILQKAQSEVAPPWTADEVADLLGYRPEVAASTPSPGSSDTADMLSRGCVIDSQLYLTVAGRSASGTSWEGTFNGVDIFVTYRFGNVRVEINAETKIEFHDEDFATMQTTLQALLRVQLCSPKMVVMWSKRSADVKWKESR